MTLPSSLYSYELSHWPDERYISQLSQHLRFKLSSVCQCIFASLALLLVWVISGFFILGFLKGAVNIWEMLGLCVLALGLSLFFGKMLVQSMKLRRHYLALTKTPESFQLLLGVVVAISTTTTEAIGSSETVRCVKWRLQGGDVIYQSKIAIPVHDLSLRQGQSIQVAVQIDASETIPLLLCKGKHSPNAV